jgi:hypothetical protein
LTLRPFDENTGQFTDTGKHVLLPCDARPLDGVWSGTLQGTAGTFQFTHDIVRFVYSTTTWKAAYGKLYGYDGVARKFSIDFLEGGDFGNRAATFTINTGGSITISYKAILLGPGAKTMQLTTKRASDVLTGDYIQIDGLCTNHIVFKNGFYHLVRTGNGDCSVNGDQYFGYYTVSSKVAIYVRDVADNSVIISQSALSYSMDGDNLTLGTEFYPASPQDVQNLVLTTCPYDSGLLGITLLELVIDLLSDLLNGLVNLVVVAVQPTGKLLDLALVQNLLDNLDVSKIDIIGGSGGLLGLGGGLLGLKKRTSGEVYVVFRYPYSADQPEIIGPGPESSQVIILPPQSSSEPAASEPAGSSPGSTGNGTTPGPEGSTGNGTSPGPADTTPGPGPADTTPGPADTTPGPGPAGTTAVPAPEPETSETEVGFYDTKKKDSETSSTSEGNNPHPNPDGTQDNIHGSTPGKTGSLKMLWIILIVVGSVVILVPTVIIIAVKTSCVNDEVDSVFPTQRAISFNAGKPDNI